MPYQAEPLTRRPVFGLMVALLPGAALAQQAEPLTDMVVTASRSEQSVAELAGNTAVVGADELSLIGHTHINEALFRVPGTWISRGNGQEHLTAIRSPVFTGPGACGEFLMAQDGIGLRAAGFCNVNELFQVNSEQAGRIEVVRGPGSALYGSNALHGMVNVITAAPPVARETVADIEAGPHGYVRGKLTTGNRYDRHAYRFNLNLAHDGGFRDDSGFDQQKSDLRWDYLGDAMSAQTVFSVTNLDQETAGFIEGADAYKDRDRIEQNDNPEAFRKVRSARLATRLDYFVDARSTVSVTPYLRWNDMDFLQHFLPQTPLEENGHTSLGVQTAWYRSLEAGSNLILGVDWELTRGFLTENQTDVTSGAFPQGLHYDYEVDAQVVSPFAQLEWQLGDATRLVGGLRLERVRYDYDNRMLSGNSAADGSTPCTSFSGAPADCRFSRPEDRSDTFDNVSPKLGLVRELGGQRQLYANLSRGFRAPQTTELYRLQGAQTVSEIESERLDSLEVGVRARAARLSYDLSVFTMRKENFIFQDGSRFVVSDGKTRHAGVELALRWRFAEKLDLASFVSYAEHKYDFDAVSPGNEVIESGNFIDTAPRTIGSVVLGFDFLPGARAELEWLHMGSYFVDAANDFEYEGHDLLNLRARYTIDSRWSVFGRILNLTDERYAERADFSQFADDQLRYFPGEPRALYVGLRGSF